MNPSNPNAPRNLSFAERMQQAENPSTQQSRRGHSQQPSDTTAGNVATASGPGAAAVGQARHPTILNPSTSTHRELRHRPNFHRTVNFEIRQSTRLSLERQADIAARSKGVQVDIPQAPTVRMKSLNKTALGFRVEWDHNDPIMRAQSEAVAGRILDFSATELPDDVANSPALLAYMGNPYDTIQFIPIDNVQPGYEGQEHNLSMEGNTDGWGSRTEGPLCQQQIMVERDQDMAYKLIAKVKDRVESGGFKPLILFGCSGGYPNPETGERMDNGTMAEKIWSLDNTGKVFEAKYGDENELVRHFEPTTFKITDKDGKTNPDYKVVTDEDGRPVPDGDGKIIVTDKNGNVVPEKDRTVSISGYIDDSKQDSARAVGMTCYNEIIPYLSKRDGQMFLHETPRTASDPEELRTLLQQPREGGRPVDCMRNERFVAGVIATFGPIDVDKTAYGPMVGVGTDKLEFYQIHNDHIASDPSLKTRFPLSARAIEFDRCANADELVASARTFGDKGKTSISKPNGTGGGHGIFKNRPGDNNATILEKLGKSLKVVSDKYTKRGVQDCGMPYSNSEAVEGVLVQEPTDPDLNAKFGQYAGLEKEMREGCLMRNQRDADGNLTGKKEIVVVQDSYKVKLPGSDVGNVTTQKALTGMKAEELVLPATSEAIMQLMNASERAFKNRAKFISEQMVFILTRKHAAYLQSKGLSS